MWSIGKRIMILMERVKNNSAVEKKKKELEIRKNSAFLSSYSSVIHPELQIFNISPK